MYYSVDHLTTRDERITCVILAKCDGSITRVILANRHRIITLITRVILAKVSFAVTFFHLTDQLHTPFFNIYFEQNNSRYENTWRRGREGIYTKGAARHQAGHQAQGLRAGRLFKSFTSSRVHAVLRKLEQPSAV